MSKRYLSLAMATLLIALFILAACGGGGGNPLVGQWQDDTGFMTFEFKADGTMSISAVGQSVAGNYKVIDATHMEINFADLGGTQQVTYSLAGNKLTLTDPITGQDIVLTRK